MADLLNEREAAGYRSQFPIFDHKIYLNSCSLGPLNRAARTALLEYADDWEEFGAPAWWLRWIPKVDAIRSLFATAVGAATDDVTVHHSISSALTSVVSSIDLSSRNRVVVADIDFPTIAYQWLAKKGVEVAFARSNDGVTVPLEEYERLVDERTAAVTTSHVFYATGAIQDVSAISAIAHRHGALSIVDGYHAVGVLPVDVNSLEVDFYVGGTLKWTCGGPGLTFVYANPRVQRSHFPTSPGWFASADQFAFETTRFNPAPTASRFQMGTPAIATVYSGIPGLSMILEASPSAIQARIRQLTRRLIDRVLALGIEVASPHDDSLRAGIVMLRVPDPEVVVSTLAKENIIVDARPGKLRISPHFFNLTSDIDAVVDSLAKIGASQRVTS